jgi:AbrB family looped-hinge helix DNA binding protein
VTRLSPKHQVTIPAATVEQLGLVPGEELQVDVDAAGRIVLTRLRRAEQRRAAVAALDDRFVGVWAADEIDRLRDEWRS